MSQLRWPSGVTRAPGSVGPSVIVTPARLDPPPPVLVRYVDIVLADFPELFWRMGETSGTTVADATGNGHTGNVGSGVVLGRAGAVRGDFSAATDGSSNGVVSSSTYNPFVSGSQRSFECWMMRYISSPNVDAPFGSTDGTVNQNAGLSFNGQNFAVWATGNQSTTFSNLAFPAGVWTHVVLTYDDTTRLAEVWFNGFKVGSQTLAGSYNGGAGHFTAGRGGGYNYYGQVDEVAVYHYILSGAQIRAHYVAGSPYEQEVRLNAPLGQWTLADRRGSGKAADVTENGHDGTRGTGTAVDSQPLAIGGRGATSFTGTQGISTSFSLFPTSTTQVTIEQTVNLSSYGTGNNVLGGPTTWRALWGIAAGSGGGGLSVASGDVSYFGVTGTTRTWAGAWPGLDQDVHVVIRINGTTSAELFINGVSLGALGGASQSVNGMLIGSHGSFNNVDGWIGTMADFNVYPGLLSDAAIKRLYDLNFYGIPRANQQAWIDFDSLALNDGDPIPSITGKSPNAEVASNATTAQQPTFKRNIVAGRSIARFGGSQRLMTGALPATTQPYTLFAMHAQNLGGGRFFGDSGAGVRAAWNRFVPGHDHYAGGVLQISSPVAETEWKAIIVEFNGASSTARTYSKTYGRLLDGTGNAGTSGNLSSGITLGASDFLGGQPYTGDLGEVLVYSALLSNDDRMLIEDWLHDRWFATPLNLARTAADALATSDAGARTAAALLRDAADTLGTSDVAVSATIQLLARTASESLGTTDAATRAAVARARVAADLLGTSDSAIRASLLRLRAAVEALNTSDLATRAAATRARSVTDALATFDTAVRSGALVTRGASDTLGTSDAAVRAARLLARAAVDVLATGDLATRSVPVTARVASDSLATTDAATRMSLLIVRAAADALVTTDNASGARFVQKFATDALGTTDAATRAALARIRTGTDALATTDSASRLAFRARAAADALGTHDAAQKSTAVRLRIAADILGTIDSATRGAYLRLRTALDALGTTDVADAVESFVTGPDLTGPLHVLVLSGVAKALAADYISKTLMTSYTAKAPADEPLSKGKATELFSEVASDDYVGKAR